MTTINATAGTESESNEYLDARASGGIGKLQDVMSAISTCVRVLPRMCLACVLRVSCVCLECGVRVSCVCLACVLRVEYVCLACVLRVSCVWRACGVRVAELCCVLCPGVGLSLAWLCMGSCGRLSVISIIGFHQCDFLSAMTIRDY